jgi:hypothetical protein
MNERRLQSPILGIAIVVVVGLGIYKPFNVKRESGAKAGSLVSDISY